MDGSRHHSGDVAKMPRMSSGLRCDWDRSRAFDINRNVSADVSCTLVHSVADLPCSQECAPPIAFIFPTRETARLKACGRDRRQGHGWQDIHWILSQIKTNRFHWRGEKLVWDTVGRVICHVLPSSQATLRNRVTFQLGFTVCGKYFDFIGDTAYLPRVLIGLDSPEPLRPRTLVQSASYQELIVPSFSRDVHHP